jgi:2-methylisocitrate lyase-like PEP mutase family enzyme
MINHPCETLHGLLTQGRLIRMPCAYDGLSARMAQLAGFQGVAFSGNAVSASLLGLPDIGVLNLTDNVSHAGRIARGLDIPMICDADTGYGGVMNVIRTVQEFEAAGVAGIHLEDQVTPKRCGLLPQGIPVLSQSQSEQKIRAAVSARRNPHFLIIARTDSRAVAGLDEAVARARAALAAGADMAFVEAAQSLEEVAAIPRLVNGPCLLNRVVGGKTPSVGFDDAQEMGYRLTILPGLLFRNAIATFDRVLGEVKANRRMGTIPGADNVKGGFQRFGMDEWNAIRDQAAVSMNRP